MNLFRRIRDTVLDTLFPRRCPICGVLPEKSDAAQLCPDCALLFDAERTVRCPVCRRPAPSCRCTPLLLRDRLDFIGTRQFVTSMFYQPDTPSSFCSRMIYALKDDTDDTAARILARDLSREILRHFLKSGEDVRHFIITYPPRTKQKRDEVGFDQAERLARLCAEYTGARFLPLFSRRGGTVQKALSGSERLQNAEASLFLRAPKKCAGQRIILCDDVLTTGSTVAACAELLRKAGAVSVFCATAAVSIQRESHNLYK